MPAARIVADDVTLDSVPAHVDPALVVDYDHMNPPGMESGDVYRALSRFHDGHWIATRAEDIKWIQESWNLFSAQEKGAPRGRMPMMPPITYDPPDHTRYRAVRNPYLAKRRIEEHYQPRARAVIAGLIESLRPNGRCEFVSQFSQVAPLVIFIDFVNLPYDRRDEFLEWGSAFGRSPDPAVRMVAHRKMSASTILATTSSPASRNGAPARASSRANRSPAWPSSCSSAGRTRSTRRWASPCGASPNAPSSSNASRTTPRSSPPRSRNCCAAMLSPAPPA